MTDKELIESIAIEVMGWRKSNLIDRNIKEYDIWVDSDGWNRFAKKVFDPPTDMNHAFMVVEKMKEFDYKTELELMPGYPWNVTFHCLKTGKDVKYDHESIGHAICLAALEAVRNKEK